MKVFNVDCYRLHWSYCSSWICCIVVVVVVVNRVSIITLSANYTVIVAIDHTVIIVVYVVDVIVIVDVIATIIRMIFSARLRDTTNGIIGINHVVVVAISNNSNARDVIVAIIETNRHNNDTIFNADILDPINYQLYLHYHLQHHH